MKRSRAAWMTMVVALSGACGSSGGSGTDPASTDGGLGDGDDASADPPGEITETMLEGTLGSLGDVQPTVASLMISNSGETILYLSSAPLACADLQESRWLGKQPTGSQIVEIVIKGAPKVQTYTVGSAEVNYAPGGKSSSYEKGAKSGSVAFTVASAAGPVAGTVSGTYAEGSVRGVFYAEFCPGGQEY